MFTFAEWEVLQQITQTPNTDAIDSMISEMKVVKSQLQECFHISNIPIGKMD